MFNNVNGAKEIDRIDKMLMKFGQTVKFTGNVDGQEFTYYNSAFITPLRYKNKIYLEGIIEKLGYIDERHYLYIGRAVHTLSGLPIDTIVQFDDKKFTVKTAETVGFGGNNVYEWAVLQAVHEGDAKWNI